MTPAAPGDGSRLADGAPEPGPVVVERPGEQPRELLDRLGIAAGAPRPVIVVAGGADDLREPQLSVARKALGPAVRAAVAGTSTAIVDGATATGVMALVGAERASDPAGMALLIGVAPEGKVAHGRSPAAGAVALEPHHTHVALAAAADWGGETPLLSALARELARGAPIVMVLAGGGEGALAEVREAIARGWPVLAIAGTGGLADELAPQPPPAGAVRRALHRAAVRATPRKPAHGGLAGADVRRCDADPGALARALTWELHAEPTVRDAWALFASYDALAGSQRRAFEAFQKAILVLGIAATALALLYNALGDRPEALRWLVIATPISVSVLIALANRRGAGKRWILLRAAAEAIKSEIYRYRTRTGVYSADALREAEPGDRPQRLAGRLTEIEAGLIQTAASGGRLTPYAGPLPPVMYGAEGRDDGFSRLDAEDYVGMRVGDQLAYYRGRVEKLDRQRSRLQLLTLVAGGVGTLLAAAGLEIWIGLTTAIAGAALAHLGYLQVDNTLVAYNRTASRLAALQREFRAGGARRSDLEQLVTRGETILTTELGGWVAQMTDALAQLQDEQAKASERAEPGADASAA